MKLQLKHSHFPENKSSLNKLPKGKFLITTINAYSYNITKADNEFTEALLNSDLLIPDGAGIVHAIKWLRGEQIERIAGWDLFVWDMNRLQSIPNLSGRELKKKRVFFLGSTEEVLGRIKVRAAIDYPDLDIYTYSPPYKHEFTEEENLAMIDAINKAQPDLLWIGMTAPKQEKWAYKMIRENRLAINCHIGCVGAVFDFYAGTIKRAPLWWQNNGIEWLYRLIKEPKRMWRRYLIGNIKFLYYILIERFSK